MLSGIIIIKRAHVLSAPTYDDISVYNSFNIVVREHANGVHILNTLILSRILGPIIWSDTFILGEEKFIPNCLSYIKEITENMMVICR